MSDTPRTDAMVEKAKRPRTKSESDEVCLAEDVRLLERELDHIRTTLKDPAAVWVNMLRGEIARPSALDHYEECKDMVERLQSELAAITKHRDDLIDDLDRVTKERDELRSELEKSAQEISDYCDELGRDTQA